MQRFAVPVLLLFTPAVSLVAVADEAVAPAARQVVVELRDSARLIGRTTLESFAFVRANDGHRQAIPVADVYRVVFADDRELAEVGQYSGESLTGVVVGRSIEVETPYARMTLPMGDVARIEFVDVGKGMIAWFPFDDDFRDATGNGNDGRSHGGVELVKGRLGKAVQFDGEDDYVEIVPNSDVSQIGDFTIATWFRHNGWKRQPVPYTFDRQYIFDGFSKSSVAPSADLHRQGFSVILDFERTNGREDISNNIQLQPGANPPYWEQNIEVRLAGGWHHLAFQRRGGEDFTFLDSKPLVGAYSYAGKHREPLNMQHTWFLGAFAGNNANYVARVNGFNHSFRGLVDDMRIYNRALNEFEVRTLWLAGERK